MRGVLSSIPSPQSQFPALHLKVSRANRLYIMISYFAEIV